MAISVRTWLALAGTIVLAACQTQSQMQNNATNEAVRVGQFEIDCPSATGTVLSSHVLQPVLWGGVEHAEYTIGVEGCGKRATYTSICPIAAFGSSDCFASAGLTNAFVGMRP